MEDRTLKQKLFEIIEKISRRVLIFRIERALGIELFDWQIAKIFDDKPFPEHVQKERRQGKTTAQILFVLLCPKLKQSPSLRTLYGFPPVLRVDGVSEDNQLFAGYEAARAAFYFGEDGVSRHRRLLFLQKLRRIKRRLNRAKIKTHQIEVVYCGHQYKV